LVSLPVDFSDFPEDLSADLSSVESVFLLSGWSSFGGDPISTVLITTLEFVVSSAFALGSGFWLSANGVPS